MDKFLFTILQLLGISLPSDENLILIKKLLEENQEQNKISEQLLKKLSEKVVNLEEENKLLLNQQNSDFIKQNLNWSTVIFILVFLILVVIILVGFFPQFSEDIQKLVLGSENNNLKAIADFLKESNNYNNLQNEQVLRLINLLLINQHVLNASISAVTNILLKRNNSRITKDILSNKTDVSSEQDLDW
jgi:uncharacterized membrane protein YvbJ